MPIDAAIAAIEAQIKEAPAPDRRVRGPRISSHVYDLGGDDFYQGRTFRLAIEFVHPIPSNIIDDGPRNAALASARAMADWIKANSEDIGGMLWYLEDRIEIRTEEIEPEQGPHVIIAQLAVSLWEGVFPQSG